MTFFVMPNMVPNENATKPPCQNFPKTGNESSSFCQSVKPSKVAH
jgi:hypothetical protein